MSSRAIVEDLIIPKMTEIVAGAMVDEMLDRLSESNRSWTVGVSSALAERLPDMIYVTLSSLPEEERKAMIEVIDETLADIEAELEGGEIVEEIEEEEVEEAPEEAKEIVGKKEAKEPKAHKGEEKK